jgi:hypothetical protein
MKKQATRLAALALSIGISACGGGSSAPPAAPVIVVHPTTQVVALDQTATFSVVATGSGTLSYQWYRDGAAIAGQTAASVTTAPVTYLDDDAAYLVTVSDDFGGKVASGVARIRLEGFVASGAMAQARQNQAATMLAGGNVLVTGGFSVYVLASAELYDPASGSFAPTGAMVNARQNQTSTLLGNGKVLVIGGQGLAGGGTPLASSELYDPSTGTFAVSGPMSVERLFQTATRLGDGTVLVTGGLWTPVDTDILASAEVYDPSTGTFAPTGAMVTARYWHTATLLPDGTVLITGGYGLAGAALDSAEIYDPVAGTFTETSGAMSWPRYGHSATLLTASGQVLVAGGYGASLLDGADLYDPASGLFVPTGPLTFPRQFQTATLLTSGKVLVAGGLTETEGISSAELYDPDFGTFTPTGSMEAERSLATATLLGSGEVLVAGGWSLGDAGLDSTERFSGAP